MDGNIKCYKYGWVYILENSTYVCALIFYCTCKIRGSHYQYVGIEMCL